MRGRCVGPRIAQRLETRPSFADCRESVEEVPSGSGKAIKLRYQDRIPASSEARQRANAALSVLSLIASR
jgi:hypothetical protein